MSNGVVVVVACLVVLIIYLGFNISSVSDQPGCACAASAAKSQMILPHSYFFLPHSRMICLHVPIVCIGSTNYQTEPDG